MKLPRHAVRLVVAMTLLSLPMLFWNCSGIGKPIAGAASQDSPYPSTINSGYVKDPGTAGALPSFQDRRFTFAPSVNGHGPYTASGVPAWAIFNSATGEVSGVPSKLSDGAVFTVRGGGGSQVFGPYTVSVTGNPLKEFQWHLKNTGQVSFASQAGKAGEDIHISNTIARGLTGAGVRVAISDSGVFLAHEGLAPNVLTGESRNYLLQTSGWLGDPTPDFTEAGNAHGTAVASLALQKGWTGRGGRGVAPDAGVAGFLYIQAQDALAAAGKLVEGTLDQFRGEFDVFNYSWNDPQCFLLEYNQTLKDKLKAGVLSQRGGKGSIYMMAAGNNFYQDIQDCSPNLASSTVFGNVNFSEINSNFYVINIAAVNSLGLSSSYSTPGSAIWVSSTGGEYGLDHTIANAPQDAYLAAMIGADFYGCSSGLKSENEYSAFDNGSAPNQECKYTSTMNGTSAATPVATGAAALMLQANPNLTWRDVKYILAKTADKINPAAIPQNPVANLNLAGHPYDQGWITNAAGFNFHNYYGFGRINVDNAVNMASTFVPGTLGTYKETNWVHDSGTISVAIPDNNATGVTRTLQVAQSMVIEATQVRVSLSDCAGDIGIEITSPGGTKSVVMNYNSRIVDGAILDHTFLSNAFLGEQAAGTWTLNVVDAHATCTANLTNWKLNFAGH